MVKLFGRQRAATEPSLIRPSAVMRSYQRLSREPETCWVAFRRWRIRLRIRMRLRVLMLYGALKLDPIAARSTFRLTLSTVMAVLLSRSWDFFFVNHFWGVDGVPGLVPGRLQYFSAMVLAGGVFCAAAAPNGGRRPMMVALLLASEGPLIGWSFKGVVSECHSSTTRRWASGSMLPLFTLGFATMSTLVAVTLVYATDRLVIDCSSKRGPRSPTAIVLKRWHEILASGVGLGVAAGGTTLWSASSRSTRTPPSPPAARAATTPRCSATCPPLLLTCSTLSHSSRRASSATCSSTRCGRTARSSPRS